MRARRNPSYPNTMIPLPFPRSDYSWGHAQPLASWTSDPEYSYQQFARSNGKLAPSPTIGIAKPYRMPDNAGPYLPEIFPYGPKGRPATYELAKENTGAALYPGFIVETTAKTSFLSPTRKLFPAYAVQVNQYDKPRYDLGERSAKVVPGFEFDYSRAAKRATEMAIRVSGPVKIHIILPDLSVKEIGLDKLERTPRFDAWTHQENVHPAVKELIKTDKQPHDALLNRGARGGYSVRERDALPAAAFLQPSTRSWPVSDKEHAFIALQYMTRGFGNRSSYPELIARLAQIWPPSRHPDIWSWYEDHIDQIQAKAGRTMPRLRRA